MNIDNPYELLSKIEEMMRERDIAPDCVDYRVMRDSLLDTARREVELESVEKVVRLKTGVPWGVLLHKLKNEIDQAHLVSLDPQNNLSFEGDSGTLSFFQGIFTKGFSSGILSNRSLSEDEILEQHAASLDSFEEAMQGAIPAMMGGVDMRSVEVISQIVSVTEAAYVSVIQPQSLNGPMAQLWVWGFVTGWEFDARKALADVTL